mmetsp:Transcript_40139/g.93241  ORF Transcript_40139/g.93241 Transcript_40139/m.93241 type:complete len:300 (-) Transcript_40139:783-1682(-)
MKGHRVGSARNGILEGLAGLLPKHGVIVNTRQTQEAKAAAQPDVLPIGHPLVLQSPAAVLQVACEDPHTTLGKHLDRSVQAFVAVVEVDGLSGVPDGSVAAEPLRQQHRVRVRLHGPLAEAVAAELSHLPPDAVEDLGVQGGVELAAEAALEVSGHDLRLEGPRGALAQRDGFVANDIPAVARENADALGQLSPDQGDLVTPWQHQGETVDRRGQWALDDNLGRARAPSSMVGTVGRVSGRGGNFVGACPPAVHRATAPALGPLVVPLVAVHWFAGGFVWAARALRAVVVLGNALVVVI